jgi:6-phosphogluconolactonase (cycloisomerase 2 family)
MAACGGNSSGGGGATKPPGQAEFLYAADEGNNVVVFSIDQTTGALNPTSEISPGGETVSNHAVTVTPSGSFVYAANDATSGINGYATNASGSLSIIAGSPFPVLPSVQPQWPVIHGITIDPKGRFLYCDSGAGFGGVAGFAIDGTSGALTPIAGSPFSSGGPNVPAMIAIDLTGRYLYASTSFDEAFLPPGYNIWAFTIDSGSGALTPVPGSPFATLENSQPDALEVDPSGRFLYVALSNAGSIAAFAIDNATGSLTPLVGSPFPTSSSQTTQTYSLTIAASGKFLFAFNSNGSTVSGFALDPTSGTLTSVAGSPFSTNPVAEGGNELITDPSGDLLYVGVGSSSEFVVFDIDASTGVLTPAAASPIAGTFNPAGLAVARF